MRRAFVPVVLGDDTRTVSVLHAHLYNTIPRLENSSLELDAFNGGILKSNNQDQISRP